MKDLLLNIIRSTPLIRPFRRIKFELKRRKWSESKRRSFRDKKNINKLFEKIIDPGSNCIDVGAHQGEFLDLFLKYAPQGKHIAFEPLAVFAKQLGIDYPQVEVFEYALSDEEGESEFFYVPKMPGWSGFKVQDYPVGTEYETIKVKMDRLDKIIGKKSATTKIHLIKIDVEGAEFKVIEGTSAILKAQRPYIIFEHAYLHSKQFGVTPTMIYDLLCKQYNYNLFSLDGKGPYSEEEFIQIVNRSFQDNYNRYAETNFFGSPDALFPF